MFAASSMLLTINGHGAIPSCGDQTVDAALADSLAELLTKDLPLFATDAAERSISSRFAHHLQKHFPGYHVDAEYNRMGNAPKRVTLRKRPGVVFPDIVVHSRNTNTNLLAIELNKGPGSNGKRRDILKLRAYRRELGYAHALFIQLGTSADAGRILDCVWVDACEIDEEATGNSAIAPCAGGCSQSSAPNARERGAR